MGVTPVRVFQIPLAPDRDEAREWAERELARPEYEAAKPTPLDQFARAVGDFVNSIFGAQAPPGLSSAVLIGLAVLAIAAIVTAFVVWGRPRAVQRAAVDHAVLFGDDDNRSATRLREAARAHANRGEWAEAIIVRMRALARGLEERGLVDLPPGATVHAFARAAGRVFPNLTARVNQAADAFDDVRYLRKPGTRARWDEVAAADDAVQEARPQPVTLLGETDRMLV